MNRVLPYRVALAVTLIATLRVTPALADDAPKRQIETLDRGLVAVAREDGSVFVSWRLLAADPSHASFLVQRDGQPIFTSDSGSPTCFLDGEPTKDAKYTVRMTAGGKSGSESTPVAIQRRPYFAIPLQTPAGYTPNDASVGDLDGDGDYEIVLHQVGQGRDNSQRGFTTEPIFEAYDLDGRMLWRIRLGTNMREGAHYNPFMVYDLDGDGRAEVACRTADGTIDGEGIVQGDGNADHRNSNGYILEGPEFLTIFDGATGRALATTDYLPPRGDVRAWGDDYGNRVDRFLAGVAYLDGVRPSLVMCRGYCTRAVLVAWDWRDGQLTHRWTFDSDDPQLDAAEYAGQGAHSLSVADVDGDGCDEIIYGACTIDHDGRGLYSTRFGHGDALHVSDLDPARPGLEVFAIHERPKHPHGANLRDAATGKVLWSLPLRDPGRGLAIDIDPRYYGCECWTNDSRGLYTVQGERISWAKPRSCNMGIWWDGDLLRELLDGATIRKWDYENGREERIFTAEGCSGNNGSKNNPCLCADLLGDWREELLCRTRDNRELRIYTTTIPTPHRLPTLMHDPVYRLSIAWQNVGYNQPAHTSFYLGTPSPSEKKDAQGK